MIMRIDFQKRKHAVIVVEPIMTTLLITLIFMGMPFNRDLFFLHRYYWVFGLVGFLVCSIVVYRIPQAITKAILRGRSGHRWTVFLFLLLETQSGEEVASFEFGSLQSHLRVQERVAAVH